MFIIIRDSLILYYAVIAVYLRLSLHKSRNMEKIGRISRIEIYKKILPFRSKLYGGFWNKL